MKLAAAFLCLLPLAACGGASTPNNTASAVEPVPSTMSPPSQAPMQAPTMSDPGDGGGPENRFIVCPGNPRCPPDGSQPKSR
jgi:hypothetical protein